MSAGVRPRIRVAPRDLRHAASEASLRPSPSRFWGRDSRAAAGRGRGGGAVVAMEAAVRVDVFTPAREDFLRPGEG
jgi:hypothetical protein